MGRKRHIMTDTLGLMLAAVVDSATIQDRDGAPLVFKATALRFRTVRHVFADGGYAGDKLREALRPIGVFSVEIIRRYDTAQGFVLLPRRWVAARTLAWPGR
jgi:putative transposase